MSGNYDKGVVLPKIYDTLLKKFGRTNWWPAESDFEVMLGAILTQNTAWANVEKAINNLKASDLLSFEAIYELDPNILKQHIKPSGYYNQKTIKIKEFINFVKAEYDFSIELMKKEDTLSIRKKLLNIFGIGEETADCILLYALKKPVFVIDTYTRRMLERHDIIKDALKEKYETLQGFFMANIIPTEANIGLYNEYHALIVMLGKTFCKKNPLCADCPLKGL